MLCWSEGRLVVEHLPQIVNTCPVERVVAVRVLLGVCVRCMDFASWLRKGSKEGDEL